MKTIFVLRVLQDSLLTVMLCLICQERRVNLYSLASSIGQGSLLTVIPSYLCQEHRDYLFTYLSLPHLSYYITLFCPLHKPKQTKTNQIHCIQYSNGNAPPLLAQRSFRLSNDASPTALLFSLAGSRCPSVQGHSGTLSSSNRKGVNTRYPV